MDIEHTPDDQGSEIPPRIGPAEDSGETRKSRPKWLAPVVAAAVVAMVVAAAFGGWRLYLSHLHRSAASDCTSSAKSLDSDAGSLGTALDKYRGAASIKANEVLDAKTVDAMHQVVKEADAIKGSSVSCDAAQSTAALQTAAGKAKAAGTRIKNLDHRLAVAAKAVTDSRDAKTLDEAKKALSSRKDEASKLLADSDGKVADPATRDALGEEIMKAGRLSSGKPADYRKESDALGRAMDAVKASMQAKADADKAAAEAKADDPSQGGSRGYATQPRRQGYGRGRVYRNPSLPPRRQNVNPPRKQAPAQNNGDQSWQDRLKNQKPIGNHGCNPDGSCGIG